MAHEVRLTLRLPQDLRDELQRLADHDLRSLNAQIVTLLQGAARSRREADEQIERAAIAYDHTPKEK